LNGPLERQVCGPGVVNLTQNSSSAHGYESDVFLFGSGLRWCFRRKFDHVIQ